MMQFERYTITVSGVEFHFTKDQLQSEPRNYFVNQFTNQAANGTNTLTLEKDPMLFRHIQTHLRGYSIFPIPEGFLPSYMDEMTALRNLQNDADVYGLRRLKDLVAEEIQRRISAQSTTRAETGPSQYRIWSHSFRQTDPPYYGAWISDGAPFPGRNYTSMSVEGLETFRSKGAGKSFECLDCLRVTPGWSFVMAFPLPLPANVAPIHYVLECQ